MADISLPLRSHLTPMQRAFISYYPEAESAADAARMAGYTGPQQAAGLLLAKPHVAAALTEQLEIREKRGAITVDRLMVELWATYQDARQERKLDAAARCIELMMRHLGAFPRPEVAIDARQQILQLPSGLSIDELRQLARGDVAPLPGDAPPDLLEELRAPSIRPPDLPSIEQSEVNVMQSSGIDSPDEQEPDGDIAET